ncbi:hypothetical protein PCANC_04789 [Puccinia coronata f. sp. avenae]|uniref:Uncharacterized protein n=1 Tax=Puccinia coronata f. sp. avenae TaxID=200324 RepID=A0A2N5VWQ9_9BASI|nr:hypothetical protein PCANC_04789 [Puccinia coronata f. sp. avenae]
MPRCDSRVKGRHDDARQKSCLRGDIHGHRVALRTVLSPGRTNFIRSAPLCTAAGVACFALANILHPDDAHLSSIHEGRVSIWIDTSNACQDGQRDEVFQPYLMKLKHARTSTSLSQRQVTKREAKSPAVAPRILKDPLPVTKNHARAQQNARHDDQKTNCWTTANEQFTCYGKCVGAAVCSDCRLDEQTPSISNCADDSSPKKHKAKSSASSTTTSNVGVSTWLSW